MYLKFLQYGRKSGEIFIFFYKFQTSNEIC